MRVCDIFALCVFQAVRLMMIRFVWGLLSGNTIQSIRRFYSGIAAVETSRVVIKNNSVTNAGYGVSLTTGSADIEISNNVFEGITECKERLRLSNIYWEGMRIMCTFFSVISSILDVTLLLLGSR